MDPEDILSSSLQSLYSYNPITFSGDIFVHKASGLTFRISNPAPSNWSLHASSIWIAAIFLANHLADIRLEDDHNVLELGAGSGIPGIVLAQRSQGRAAVTLSDYPDDAILRVLQENIKRNDLANMRVVGHSWGEDTAQLGIFDVVLAADTLWNPEHHLSFCHTLSCVLRRTSDARIYLVAGLHTGRWTVQRFLEKLTPFSLEVDEVYERKADNVFDSDAPQESLRPWEPDRDEDETERRRWVVWIVLKWAPSYLAAGDKM